MLATTILVWPGLMFGRDGTRGAANGLPSGLDFFGWVVIVGLLLPGYLCEIAAVVVASVA